MNSNTFRMPARRRGASRRRAAAVTAAAVALASGSVVLAGPAHASGGEGGKGRAAAAVLRTDLDVSLLDKAVVPLTATLNEVKAPASAEKTALTAKLDGVDRGRPFQVLRADVATAKATADRRRAEGYVHLARARVHVPGLPLLSLIEVRKVTSKAVCEVGEHPVVKSNVLGDVKVLGKEVNLTAGGTADVDVPGVGRVTLHLSKTQTTSRTAAATALELKVTVNPVRLNVADVQGTVTLAKATCESPGQGGGPGDGSEAAEAAEAEQAEQAEQAGKPQQPGREGQPEQPQDDAKAAEPGGETGGQGASAGTGSTLSVQSDAAQPAKENLAATGSSSATPYLAGGAALLLAAGGSVLALSRARRSRVQN
ncbi:SCO1860 family LAETG-anchored protein [Streptomyces sp. HNM0663]|uniref:SCO1860 family LAETG-anchored protein n=1 Tax=Streptomyces chengmaiensis TaxID=3040919 RepID=A0ABT6HNR3_9ACTN|nr:SCO1860 family LAETG-anchored protein [Streptomyces chengmaiensis]MDH2390360.1 SCO1860 family LAETG-anchored protein [Streptomyces chengmaiensis]